MGNRGKLRAKEILFEIIEKDLEDKNVEAIREEIIATANEYNEGNDVDITITILMKTKDEEQESEYYNFIEEAIDGIDMEDFGFPAAIKVGIML